MCGIIGYVGSTQLSIDSCIDILKALEVEQLPIESSPVGGHGAGLMVYDGLRVLMGKVGGGGVSPVEDLRRLIYDSWKVSFSRIVLGHVRRASQVFTHTIPFKECTQPYIADCLGKLKIVSVHNGFLKNYLDLKGKLKHKHKFESESVALIDSEVFPHLLEELILDYGDGVETAKMLFESIEGGNTVAMMVLTGETISLYVVHKGVTRGLALWRNGLGRILFASRSYIVDKFAGGFLKENGFDLDFIVKPRSEGSLVRYYRFSVDELFKS